MRIEGVCCVQLVGCVFFVVECVAGCIMGCVACASCRAHVRVVGMHALQAWAGPAPLCSTLCPPFQPHAGECYRQDIQQSTWRAYSSTPASPAPTVPASAATALETKGSFQALQNVKEEKAAGATTGSQPSKATLAVPEARSASNPSKNGSAVPPALGNSLEDVGGSNPDAPVSASDGKMAATTVSEASNMDDGTAENGSKHPTQATCTHAKHWKRLRAKRGSAYFLCFQCGAKWRTCSQAMRAQQEANESAENSDRSDPEIPVAAPSPAFTP